MDLTRSVGRLSLGAHRVGAGELLAPVPQVWADLATATVLAAEAAGLGRRPVSTNQGVAIRAADAYLDTQNIRLTTYRAASLLDEGREDDAARAALVAKWWVGRGGLRVVLATQHLHGGIGADVDYPIHRYFLWGRQLAFSLGSAAAVEAELGDLLADLPSA